MDETLAGTPPALAPARIKITAASAKAITERNVTEPWPIAWTHIDGDGGERVRTGHVWCSAPAPARWWVLPSAVDSQDPPCGAVALAWAARRHLVGRQWWVEASEGPYGVLRPARWIWEPKGGRFVDKGEVYSTAHIASPLGALGWQGRVADNPPPRAIRGGVEMWLSWVKD